MSQTANSVRLTDVIAPVFYPVHVAIKRGLKSSFWLEGGRGSTKSSFAAIEIVQGMVRDPLANAVGLRKVGDTIRSSMLSTLEWAIGQLKMALFWRATTSPAELIYTLTGQKIILRGLDDPLKMKSIKVKNGYFKFLWWEEASEFDGEDEMRNVRQSVLRGGQAFIEFLTYNPPPDEEHWINAEAAKDPAKRPERMVHRSCYLDINPAWLGPKFLEEAARVKEEQPLKYANEYLGEKVGLTEAVIFAGKVRVREFTPQPEWHGPYLGADWGFSTDPSVLVKCWISDQPDAKDPKIIRRRLHIEYDSRTPKNNMGVGVELEEIGPMFETVPGARKHKIIADSARPETISYVKRQGFNVEGAEKGPGSIEDGIEFLLSFYEIEIHPRCIGIIAEARLYKYKIDKLTKKVTADIVDAFNHGWDAVRYAVEKVMKSRRGFFSP